MPERREIDTRIIMPVSRPIVFQSMPLSASSWSSAPMTTITEAPSSATIARLSLSQMMTRVGDAQDDGRDHHRIEAEEDVRHELLRRHADLPRMGRQGPGKRRTLSMRAPAPHDARGRATPSAAFQSEDQRSKREARECRRRRRSATTHHVAKTLQRSAKTGSRPAPSTDHVTEILVFFTRCAWSRSH